MIYLDYNRTTPVAVGVLDAMKPFWTSHFLLPSQEHACGKAVSEAIEDAREKVAGLMGCEPFEVVFTAGGTEADNLAILGHCRSDRHAGVRSKKSAAAPHALISSLESDGVYEIANQLRRQGWEIDEVPCDGDGWVDPDAVAGRMNSRTRWVAVQMASPILGTIQSVAEIAAICRQRGVHCHCDATQSWGKIPIHAASLGTDTVSLSAHKIFGPKGVGALYVRRGFDLAPIQYGEPREMGLRPGSENVTGCVGMGAAAEMAARVADEAEAGLRELSNDFLNGVISSIEPAPELLGEAAARLPNTLALRMPGDANRIQQATRQLVMATPQSLDPPDEMTRTLRAIGLPPAQIGRIIRFSIGSATTRDELSRAVELLADGWESVR
ncbi:MAG: aminotransferase class V-fold PLP-dependent enzyme [Planctomycetota bacterium]